MPDNTAGAAGADPKTTGQPVAGADPNAGKAAPNAGAGGGNDAGKGADAGAASASGGDAPKGWWNETWRQDYSKGDKAKETALGRYKTAGDAIDALFELRKENGNLRNQVPPGKDATPEQIAEYRKGRGIPEKAEGYWNSVPKELTFSENDKTVVNKYLTEAHARGDDPAVVAANLKLVHDTTLQAIEMMKANDGAARTAFEQEMRNSLGAEYDDNMGRAKVFIETYFPKEMQQALMNARLGDEKGTPLMLSAGFMKSLMNMARTINPANINLPGGNGADIKTINDRIAAHEKRMGTDWKGWHRDKAAQAELRDLYDLRENMKKAAGK